MRGVRGFGETQGGPRSPDDVGAFPRMAAMQAGTETTLRLTPPCSCETQVFGIAGDDEVAV